MEIFPICAVRFGFDSENKGPGPGEMELGGRSIGVIAVLIGVSVRGQQSGSEDGQMNRCQKQQYGQDAAGSPHQRTRIRGSSR